jgi:Uma2 family endonuclease
VIGMAIGQQGLTLEEFLALPETKPALEYADGTATRKVAPKGQHSTLQAELVERINRVARPRKSARAWPELRTTYAGRSYVPDLVVYRAARIPRTAAGEIPDDIGTVPDITVEIVSPWQSLPSLVRRCSWYVANGVVAALLVDPVDRSVTVFRPGGPPAALRGDDAVDLRDVVPDLQFPVRDLFAALNADYWP